MGSLEQGALFAFRALRYRGHDFGHYPGFPVTGYKETMKRSEINRHIRTAEQLFETHGFKLPPWAHWTPEQWQDSAADLNEIVDRGLGWDITDFNQDRFDSRGLVLCTLRNGRLEKGHKPYAEKAMMVGEHQETPFHYHWTKIEDIINRGGGTLVLELHWEDASGGLSDKPVEVAIDGIHRTFESGEYVTLTPGESITLPVGLYHRFWATGAPVLAGEVSMVNDDQGDNRFLEPLPRFPNVVEDESPYRLLVTDYAQFLGEHRR